MAEGKKAGKVTKDMAITEILEKRPEAAAVLLKHGFHCLGCVAAQFETLEQGAKAQGIDPDMLVKEINKASEKESSEKGKEKE